MVLNIFPRRKEPAEEAAPESLEPLPEPSPEALDEPRKRPVRRGSRGGRGRARAGEGATVEPAGEEEVAVATAPEAAEEPATPPRRSRRSRAAVAAPPPEAAEAGVPAAPEPEAVPPPEKRGRREPRVAAEEPRPAGKAVPDGSTASILRAIEQQNRQIERLIHLQEEMARRPGGAGAPAAAPARVGVFVDAANIELASDRLRARFDWGKILRLLTENRQLVRAVAYSPVHDDPNVSIETQRFVEPFLDKGYKIVTKALKRFQDGTIKANVDIELALDVVAMLDRLDVVCLVSGDGDFQRLVEMAQARGVRVEVVAVGSSTAGGLRNAADQFIDLQSRLREVRV